jgi:hypothetical protein
MNNQGDLPPTREQMGFLPHYYKYSEIWLDDIRNRIK